MNQQNKQAVREQHRIMMNRKYRIDLTWIILSLIISALVMILVTAYASSFFDFIDNSHPLVGAGLVLGSAALCIGILKAIQFFKL